MRIIYKQQLIKPDNLKWPLTIKENVEENKRDDST